MTQKNSYIDEPSVIVGLCGGAGITGLTIGICSLVIPIGPPHYGNIFSVGVLLLIFAAIFHVILIKNYQKKISKQSEGEKHAET